MLNQSSRVLGNQAPSSHLFDPYDRLRHLNTQLEEQRKFKARKTPNEPVAKQLNNSSSLPNINQSQRVRKFGDNVVLRSFIESLDTSSADGKLGSKSSVKQKKDDSVSPDLRYQL